MLAAAPIHDAARLAVGVDFVVGLHNNGTVYAWGSNSSGELGAIAGPPFPAVPRMVPGMSRITAVAAGFYHATALREDGKVWAWGKYSWGQLGRGTFLISRTPVQVLGLSNVTAVSAAYLNAAALKADGTVWGWGDYHTIRSPVPAQVPGLSGIRTIASGPAICSRSEVGRYRVGLGQQRLWPARQRIRIGHGSVPGARHRNVRCGAGGWRLLARVGSHAQWGRLGMGQQRRAPGRHRRQQLAVRPPGRRLAGSA